MNSRIVQVFAVGVVLAIANVALRDISDVRADQVAKDNVANDNAAIKKLLKDRRDVLAQAFEATMREFETGRAAVDRVTNLSNDLLAANLEIAQDKGIRMRAYVDHLRIARDLEGFALANLQNGTGTQQEMLIAKANRIQAEIAIARSEGE